MTLKEVDDIDSLSQLLSINKQNLTYLLYKLKPNNCYRQFGIPKRNGGIRIISAPFTNLKVIQKTLASILLEYYETFIKDNNLIHIISYGYEKKKNIYDNANIHKNKRFILNIGACIKFCVNCLISVFHLKSI